jgi:hypothetical protein
MPSKKKKKVTTDLDPAAAVSGRMFLGTLDDSVTRYPWDGAASDIGSLTATLIYHALLGPRLCCRLGNLLYHGTYLRGCLDDLTPLIPLSRSGFFQVHTREDGINKTIESRLEERTNTTIEFERRHQWKKGSTIYRRLDQFQGDLGVRGHRRYHADFQKVFRALVEKAAPSASEQFKAVHARWMARPESERTRSNFEIECEKTYPKQHLDYDNRRAAMSPVNSANHYGYGIAMAKLYGETHEAPFIDTMELGALNGFTRSVLGDDDRMLSYERTAELAKSRAFDIVQRHLIVPLGLFRSSEMWTKFAQLLDIAAPDQASRDCRILKLEVLLQIKRLLESTNVEQDKQLLRERCKEYSKFIRKSLGDGRSGLAGIKASLSLGQAGAEVAASDKLKTAAEVALEGTKAAASATADFATSFGASVIVAIGTKHIGYAIKRRIDRAWAKPNISSQTYFSENLRPFLSVLSVKQIDLDAAARLGAR